MKTADGLTILPLLVEAHAHAYMDPRPLEPASRREPGSLGFDAELAAARIRMEGALRAGIGTVWDLGDPLGVNLALAETTAGDPSLPLVKASGAGFHRTGRYGRFVGRPVAGLPELLAGIRKACADPRVSFIKLVATGIIHFARGEVQGAPQFTLDELKAAVDLAGELGRPAVAHCSGAEGVRLAAEAGAVIEHGYFMDSAALEILAERKLAWTPTFAPVHAQWAAADRCGHDAATRTHLRRILDGHAETLRRAHAMGVPLLPGSDAGAPGVAHGEGLILELELMQEAGIPAADLLEMATDKEGPGRMGVDGDPARDIRDLRKVRWASRSGPP